MSTNNQVEAYVLLQGLNIATNFGIQTLSVVGDSKNIIRHLVLNTTPGDTLLASVLEQIQEEINKLLGVKLFHVL
jgi:ribonuclease HI